MRIQTTSLTVIFWLLLLFNPACSFTDIGSVHIQRHVVPSFFFPSQMPVQKRSQSGSPFLVPRFIIRGGERNTLSATSIETENGDDPEYPWSFTG